MGKHLLSYKKGWQSEHLANFILSKFAFLSRPITISDDIGTDFYGTLFKIVDGKYVQPKNSFAIQIKSKKNTNLYEITPDRADYLFNLEIPFFMGIVDRGKLTLTVYSGEILPHFQTHYGGYPRNRECLNDKLFIKLVENIEDRFNLDEINGNNYYMKFPEVVAISAEYDYIKSGEQLNELFELCRLIQENIASKISKEYIFKTYKNPTKPKIFMGPDSYKYFKINFFYRLAEAIYNYHWMSQNNLPIIQEEFNIYKELYNKLHLKYDPLQIDLSGKIIEVEKSFK